MSLYEIVKDHMLLTVIHVDDCYVIGKLEFIKQAIKDTEAQGLKLKTEFNTKDYFLVRFCSIKRKIIVLG
jgi:NAD(P)H-flavin reductase